ncbi:MAG: hypothetical protein HQK89_12370 [Nitrospirae bacterium]|nr:hypothetical protein [Nitrospirota bacterium]
MAVISIPRALRDRLGDEASDDFATIIKEIDIEARKEAISIAEERFERRLAEEIGKVKIEIEKLRSDFKLYFVILLFAIIITNPRALDLISRLLGIVK